MFDWGSQTYVMGILNVTPDSFSGDGVLSSHLANQNLIDRALQLEADGAHILDIGGVSTRPGSLPVSEEEELRRVIPALLTLKEIVEVPLSVDTYRATVAHEALKAGASWVNDVWGLRMDRDMARTVAESGCHVVVMHNRSTPQNVEQQRSLGGRYTGVRYENLMGDIVSELEVSIGNALEAGVSKENIIVDPGIGFGKTVSQNLHLLNKLEILKQLGYPILIGPSRKSFIGYTLDVPVDDRVEGTAATVAIGIDRGADIVRVHDVKEMSRVARMTDSIVR